MSQLLLSEQEKSYLISVLKELDPSAPTEKRTGIRRKVHLELSTRRLGKDAPQLPQNITLVNISKQGLAFTTDSTLSIGEHFVVPLEFTGENATREGGWLVLGQVKNVRQLPSGLQKVGAKFIAHIDDPTQTARIPKSWLTP